MPITSNTKALELTTSYQTAYTVSAGALSASVPSLNIVNSGPILPSSQSPLTEEQIYLGAQLVDADDTPSGFTHPISTRMSDGTRIIVAMDNGGELATYYVQAVWDDTTNDMMRCGTPLPLFFQTSRSLYPSRDFAVCAISDTRFAVHTYSVGTSIWSYDPVTKNIRNLTSSPVNGTWGSGNRVSYAPVDDTSFLVAGDTGTQYNISRLSFDANGVITVTSILTASATNSYIKICRANPDTNEYAYTYFSGGGNIWTTVRADFNSGTNTLTTVTTDSIDTGTGNTNSTVGLNYLNENGAGYGVLFTYKTATGAIQGSYYSSDTATAVTSTTSSTYSGLPSHISVHDAGNGQVVYKNNDTTGSFLTVFRHTAGTLTNFLPALDYASDRYHTFAFDGRIYSCDYAVSHLHVLSGGVATRTDNHLISYGHSNGKRFTWNDDAQKYICVKQRHIWTLDPEFNIIGNADFGGTYGYCESFDVVSDDPTSIVAVTSATPAYHYNVHSYTKYIQRVTLPQGLNGTATIQFSRQLVVTGSPPNNWNYACQDSDILSAGGNRWIVWTTGYRASGASYYSGIFSGDDTFSYYDYFEGTSIPTAGGRWGSNTMALINYDSGTYTVLAAQPYSTQGNGYLYRIGPFTFTGAGTVVPSNGLTSANYSNPDNWGSIGSYRTSSKRHAIAGWLSASSLDGSPLRSYITTDDPWIWEAFWYGDTSYIAHGISSGWSLYENGTSISVSYSGSTYYLWGRAQMGMDALGGFYSDEDSQTRFKFYAPRTVNFTLQLNLNGGSEQAIYVQDYPVASGQTVEITNPIILEANDFFQLKASNNNYLTISTAVMELS